MVLASYFTEQAEKIENCLDELVPTSKGPHERLFDAARYSLLGSGKRIRPILALTVCEMLGGDVQQALRPAAALEMIHTYSLIHDDLPCMDNDDFRRGKPTLHKVYPESHALLAGDFLLTHAFFVLSSDAHLSPEVRIRLIELLGRAAGGHGMIGGQLHDIEAGLMDKVSLDRLHRAKTGALIEASVGFGAILGGSSDKEYKTLQDYARAIGLAFQIVDDVLDVTASEEKHGKASDQTNGKQTYATLLGVEGALTEAKKLHHSALTSLQKLPYDTGLLQALTSYIVTRKK